MAYTERLVTSRDAEGAQTAVSKVEGKSNHAATLGLGGGERARHTSSGSVQGSQTCLKCQQPIAGQFVRALDGVYHLNCFVCLDCGKVVASKFFPIETNQGQFPLCETDYFRRLNLICNYCGGALRGSYITALADAKYHVEHFMCCVCPTVFGPQDSYYEHKGSVYCHLHYSTRYAVKCTGCNTAILKQFVEINRYDRDEHWHPECYMINKFWNTKIATGTAKVLSPPLPTHADDTDSEGEDKTKRTVDPDLQPDYKAQEARETAESLKEQQRLMEEKVFRIWTVLSTFEESAAACISEMLRFVSNAQLSDGVRMLERFILHVETLFAALDDLTSHFRMAKLKAGSENSHSREARMLCKKTVNFFSLLSQTQNATDRKISLSQELLGLVTSLAHYLKILIRIALTSSLKLEREVQNVVALKHFLNRLDRLARDYGNLKIEPPTDSSLRPSYGYKSLANISKTLGQPEPPVDHCEGCKTSIDEECARIGIRRRWHLVCLRCHACNRAAGRDKSQAGRQHIADETPLPVKEFGLETVYGASGKPKRRIWCYACAHEARLEAPLEPFEYSTRLEQYAYLLWVALNKLHLLLQQRDGVGTVYQSMVQRDSDNRSLYEAYRDSTDIKRMKSVNLDRKLSTTARQPKRSTVVESPSGRVGTFASSQAGGSSSRPHANVPALPKSPLLPNSSVASPSQTISTSPPKERGPITRMSSATSITSDKPPRPPPLDPDRYGISSSQPGSSVSSPAGGRPPLARSMTAIKVVDDQPVPRANADQYRSAIDAEDGLTLGDLHSVIEAEQARSDSTRSSARFNKGVLLSDLSALQFVVLKHAAVLVLTSETPLRDLATLDDFTEFFEIKRNTFWNKFFKADKKANKKKGVFGTPLSDLIAGGGVDSMLGAGATPLRVPSFIDDVISAMKQMDMSIEGIFRKNGNIKRLKDLTEALDKDPASVNLVEDNPVQLAALLKKFLRELPEPLLTFKLYPLFIACSTMEDQEQRIRCLHLLTIILPKPHRDTMEVLFIFFKWVASFSHIDEETGSKMDLNNMATVISPNILYGRARDPNKDESFRAIRAVSEMLEHQDRLFMVPDELFPTIDRVDHMNAAEVTSKDIFRYCREAAQHAHLNAGHPIVPSRAHFQPPVLSLDMPSRRSNSPGRPERPMSAASWQNISPSQPSPPP